MLEEKIDNLTVNTHGALIDTAIEVLRYASEKIRISWIYATREDAPSKEEQMNLLQLEVCTKKSTEKSGYE